MDPLDAIVLVSVLQQQGEVSGTGLNKLASELGISRDQLDLSCQNLKKLELFVGSNERNFLSPFGREFLLAISD
jgi:hypothetical protein